MNQRLERGVWGVLATPFQGSSLDVDESSLERAARFYADLRITGLTVLGVFGEAATLALAEQAQVLEVVVDVADAVPLVVGLPALATRVAIEQGQQAVQISRRPLAALMVQVNSSDVADLSRHLRAVHDETGCPIVVQDYPLVTGVRIAPAALARVVTDNADIVAAVKLESPPTTVGIGHLAAASDVPIFGGLGGVGLLDELACGSAGAMTGFSFPEALLATVAAFRADGFDAARNRLASWLPIANFEAQPQISLAIRKELLRLRGLFIESSVRPPAAPLPDSLISLTRRHFEAAQNLPAA